jgi:hypothetical protein
MCNLSSSSNITTMTMMMMASSQAISLRLPITVVQALRFPLPIFIPPAAPYSITSVSADGARRTRKREARPAHERCLTVLCRALKFLLVCPQDPAVTKQGPRPRDLHALLFQDEFLCPQPSFRYDDMACSVSPQCFRVVRKASTIP